MINNNSETNQYKSSKVKSTSYTVLALRGIFGVSLALTAITGLGVIAIKKTLPVPTESPVYQNNDRNMDDEQYKNHIEGLKTEVHHLANKEDQRVTNMYDNASATMVRKIKDERAKISMLKLEIANNPADADQLAKEKQLVLANTVANSDAEIADMNKQADEQIQRMYDSLKVFEDCSAQKLHSSS